MRKIYPDYRAIGQSHLEDLYEDFKDAMYVPQKTVPFIASPVSERF